MFIIIYFWIFFFRTPYCGLMFNCGCFFGWNHDQQKINCNVHNTVGPYCPFCVAKSSVSWLISRPMFITLMFVSYLLLAFKHWGIYKMICKKQNNDVQQYELSAVNSDPDPDENDQAEQEVIGDEENNDDIIIDAKSEYCLGYMDKRIWQRILIWFVVFAVWGMTMGVSLYAASQYPYFLWWETDRN